MDLREADLEPGQVVDRMAPNREGPLARARRELQGSSTKPARQKYADDLVANTDELYDRTRTLTFTADQIANGSAACSTRLPPARSPARRSTGPGQTSGTSRPTSTGRASGSMVCVRCLQSAILTSTQPSTPSSSRYRRCSTHTARAMDSCSTVICPSRRSRLCPMQSTPCPNPFHNWRLPSHKAGA